MNPVSNSISNKIKWFYFFAGISIILFHISFFNYNMIPLNSIDTKIYNFFMNFSLYSAYIGLGFFFFMNAFWFFRNLNSFSIYLTKIKKQIKVLLIPCLIWNFFAILAYCNIHDFGFTFDHLWYVIVIDPINKPLWTLIAFFLLDLVTLPFIFLNNKWKTVALSTVLVILISMEFGFIPKLSSDVFWINNTIKYSIYFVIGGLFSVNFSNNILKNKYSEKKYYFLGFFLLIFSIIFIKYIKIAPLSRLVYFLCLVGLWLIFNEKFFTKPVPAILDCNFLIYVTHIITGNKVFSFINRYISSKNLYGFQIILIQLFIVFCVILVANIIKFICKHLLSEKANYLITGGR